MDITLQSWRRRRLVKRLVFIAAVIILAGAYQSDRLLFSWPAKQEAHYVVKLGRKLEKHGLHAVLTFDEPVIRESVRLGPCGSEQTRCVSGRTGNARSFAESDSGMIWTDVKWRELGTAYSISMWVKIPSGFPDQAIMWWTGGNQKTGVLLSQGRLIFAVPGQSNSVLVSYPFEKHDRYVFLTACVDRDAGFARLYEDGELKAEGKVTVVKHPARYVVFGKMSSLKIGFPFLGELDETAFWTRALSDADIKKLYRKRESLVENVGGSYARKYEFADAVKNFMKDLPRYVELFNPLIHSSRLDDMGLPVCDVFLSGEDQRWMNSQQGGYLKNRTITEKGQRSRKVKLALNGKTVNARMALFYPPAMTSSFHRMSYVVKLNPGDAWRGMNTFVLLAPDDYGLLMPLMESAISRTCGLPAGKDGLAVLRFNGSIRGAYYCADYPNYAFEKIHRRLNAENLIRTVPLDENEIMGLYDELAERYGKVLANDTLNGISARETFYRLRCDRENLKTWIEAKRQTRGDMPGAVAAMLDPNMIRGENASLLCITTNLSLGRISIPGMDLTWTSSRTDVIDETGRVSRPANDDPVEVELRLDIRAGSISTSRVYRAVVQPADYQIPVVRINSADFPNNIYRIPCVAEISGGGIGMSAGCGAIKMRGNSAISYPKKSFSIAMDCPHSVFGESKSRHLYFVGCGKDPALIRNKLAYDLFRDLSGPATPRQVSRVEMVELVLNGEYLGIYQLMQRVDRCMLGWPDFNPQAQRHSVLYKSDGAEANFLEPRPDQYQQMEPDERVLPYWEPFYELIRLLGESPPDEFRAKIGDWIDIANVADFHLFLLLSHNRDGDNHNLYLARTGEAGSRFFIIPWDYDIAFRNSGFLSNGLLKRLEADDPGYHALLKKRWEDLRGGVFSEKALLDRVDALHVIIAPAMVREKIAGVEGASGVDGAMDELKSWITHRLSEVDRHLADL